MSRKHKRFKISNYKNELELLGKGLILVASVAYTIKNGGNAAKAVKAVDVASKTAHAGMATQAIKAGEQITKETAGAASTSARYIVENQAFNTGQWYTKTATNSKATAFSIANTSNWGRASRVKDTVTGEIVNVFAGEPSYYKVKP